MKTVFSAGLALVLISHSAASAETVFRGSLLYTASSGCNDVAVGDEFNSVYHPNEAGNDPYVGLTTIEPYGGSGYQLLGGKLSDKFKKVSGVGLAFTPFSWEGSEIRISQQSPEKIRKDTRLLTLEGQIKKPENDTDECIVSFEAAYRRDIRN